MEARRMKVLPLIVFVFASLNFCSGYDKCVNSIRSDCQNITSALKSGSFKKCLDLWHTSKWIKHSTDVSAECVYCLHFTGLPPTARSVVSLCSSPKLTPETREKCSEVLSKSKHSSKPEDGAVYFCNVFDQCDSHTYLGHLDYGSSICEDCEKIITDIRALVADNATSSAISAKLSHLVCDHVCTQLKKSCYDNVEAHIPTILNMIAVHIVPRDVCALLGLCAKPSSMVLPLENFVENAKYPVVSKNPVSHTKCEKETKFSWTNRPSAKKHPKWTSKQKFVASTNKALETPSGQQCEEVLEQIRITVHNPELQEEIKEKVDTAICSILPSILKSMCTTAVNEHFDEAIKNMDKVNLKDVCTLFGMPQVTNVDKCSPTPQALLQPALPIPGVCQVCEIVFSKLLSLLIDEPTEASITAALEKVCLLLPHAYVEQCNHFVEKYGAKIVEAIIAGTAPKVACASLGLCGAMPVSKPIPPKPLGNGYCDTCKLLVTLAENQLAQNQTEEQLKALVDKMCEVLPGSYVGECKSLVDAYLPKVIEYLTKQMSAEDICKTIGLCPPTLIGTNKQANMCHRGPSHWCSSPERIVECNAEEYCKKLLLNQQPELGAQLICKHGNLNEICATDEMAAKCDRTIDCLSRRMIQYLQLTTQYTQKNTQRINGVQNCSVCQQLVARFRMDRKLFGGPIVGDNMCSRYPYEGDRKQCELVLNNGASIMQKLLENVQDSMVICKELALCTVENSHSSNNQIQESLPAQADAMILACADGPTFWCSSIRNAKACGLENFCKAFKWFAESTPTDIFGSPSCAWGASYWCMSEETARQCGDMAFEHCRRFVWPSATKPVSVLVETDRNDLCQLGVVFWCENPENAKMCNKEEYCRQLSVFQIPSTK